ncbi:MAG: hypothetical protein K9L22_03780 [Methylococcaceae bacterium]|nr:hypothetical protein [Methylococcaceae bacterium]
MVKRREAPASNLSVAKEEPTPEQIEAFAAGVDGGNATPKEKTLDQNAPRNFKTISVPFNEYEYEQLVKGINLSGRTKLNFVRYAMLKLAKELQDEAKN